MTVAELMTLLATMPQDATVRFPDTYEQCEGWEEGHDSASLVVGGAVAEDGAVMLWGEEDYEDEEDEEFEWEEDE